MNKKLLAILFIFISLLGLVGCRKVPEMTQKTKDYFSISVANMGVLNPVTNTDKYMYNVFHLIYEGLIKYGDGFKIEPDLAESWTWSDDGRLLTFNLRKNVKWHDGSDFTSKDVKFTFDAIMQNANNPYHDIFTKMIEKYYADGDYTFRILLKEPNRFILNYMDALIVSSSYYHSDMASLNNDVIPVGTGPYKVVEYKKRDYMKLERNSSWWGGSAKINSIIVKFAPDINSAISQFEIRDVDIAFLKDFDWDKYKAVGNVEIYPYSSRKFYFIAPNFQNIILQDKIVRQAIMYALNRDEMVNKVFLGHAFISDIPVSRDSWFYNRDMGQYNFDPEQAKKLLESDGWIDSDNDGIRDKIIEGRKYKLYFRLFVNNDNELKKNVAEMIKRDLSKVGITVDIVYVPFEDLTNRLKSRNFEMALLELNLSYAPDLSYFFDSKNTYGYNLNSYSNFYLDSVMSSVKTSFSDDDFYKKMAEEQNLIKDELPYIGLFFESEAIGANNLIKGINPLNTNVFNHIENWTIGS